MAYLLIVVPIIWLYPNLWSAVFCFVLFLPVKILIRITANKTFASVLFEKLDAFAFQKIINALLLLLHIASVRQYSPEITKPSSILPYRKCERRSVR